MLRRLASKAEYPDDILQDLYLEGYGRDIQNPDAWFKRAIWTRVAKKEYNNHSIDASAHDYLPTPQEGYDHTLDGVYDILNHLDEFDRTIFMLYLQGYCMKCVAQESGISYLSIADTIYQTKCLLTKHLGENG